MVGAGESPVHGEGGQAAPVRRVGRCAGCVTPKPLSVPSGLRTWTDVT